MEHRGIVTKGGRHRLGAGVLEQVLWFVVPLFHFQSQKTGLRAACRGRRVAVLLVKRIAAFIQRVNEVFAFRLIEAILP